MDLLVVEVDHMEVGAVLGESFPVITEEYDHGALREPQSVHCA
jgi:hypothetical protein